MAMLSILMAREPKSQVDHIRPRCRWPSLLEIEGYRLPTPLHLVMAEASVKSPSTVANWRDSHVLSYSAGEVTKVAMEGLVEYCLATLSCSQSPKSEKHEARERNPIH